MDKVVKIKNDVYWVGVLDPDLEYFDIVWRTPWGTSYNSYLVKGNEKIALIETVKEPFYDEYIDKIKSLVDLKDIDYIIMDHTEPDHSGALPRLLKEATNAEVIGSRTAITFLKGQINRDFNSRVVKDGDFIDLGGKTLKFIMAPFLHWPDTMFTYLVEEKILFTCDAFGCHYTPKHLFNDLEDDFSDAYKLYFDSIVSPFKPKVLEAIEKIRNLPIDMIAVGHGPILRKDIEKYVETYKKWSLYDTNAKKKVLIYYVSAYGNTRKMAEEISNGIKDSGVIDVDIYNAKAVNLDDARDKIEKSDGLLFGSPTITGDAVEPIWDVIDRINPIKNKNKPAAVFGSYGWSGEAIPLMEERLKGLKLNLVEPGLKINFIPSDDDLEKCRDFGRIFASSLV